jgi:Mor family transcriptional regulator
MLIRHGETRADAEKLSRDFVMSITHELQGNLLYFGKNTLLNAQTKYGFIRDDFRNGQSIEQLAESYNLSTRRIHSIIHKLEDSGTTKAATTAAPVIALVATRMFLKIGLAAVDATSATRGLLAVISAKAGGNSVYIAKPRTVQNIIKTIDVCCHHRNGKSIRQLGKIFSLPESEISTIIEAYPIAATSGVKNLDAIAKQIFNMTAAIRSYVETNLPSSIEKFVEINTLLTSAESQIIRSEQILKNLERGIIQHV